MGLLLGGRVFYNFEKVNLARKKYQKGYCVNSFKIGAKYCYETKLTYPDIIKISNFPYKDSLKKECRKALDNFVKKDIKSKVLDNFNNGDTSIFFDYEDVRLFSLTKIGYSLKYRNSLYEGGAHENYYEGFKNFYKGKKELKLKDIVIDKKRFKNEAQKIYKEQRGLAPNDPLTKDGWFDNKFVLANEFAITNDGILFLYNPYEVKPFALGITKFLVPFDRVKKYLNLSFLKPILNTGKGKSYYFIDEDEGKIYLELSLNRIKSNKFLVSAKIFNFSEFSDKAWLSLSLPQFFEAKDIVNLKKIGFSSVRIYPKGRKIYNIKKDKSIRAKYILVEGELKNLKVGEFSFELKMKSLNFLKIYLRSSIKENGKKEPYTFPMNFSPEYKTDQQGFSVFVVIQK